MKRFILATAIACALAAATGCRTTTTTVYMCPNAIQDGSAQTSQVPTTANQDKKVEIAHDATVSAPLTK